jgi:hypothetical protein
VTKAGRTVFALLAVLLAVSITAPAAAQSASVWFDANAAHSRPPSGAQLDAASYGLLGLRLRVEDTGSALGLAGTAGRGAADGSGAWVDGRASLLMSRVRGAIDFGVRGEGAALTYVTPVRLNAEDDYSQTLATGGVTPFVGFSVGGFRLGAEATYTRGIWRSQVSTLVSGGGPNLPLPGMPIGPGAPQRATVTADGDVVVTGGAASLLRVAGPATVELRATRLDVRNQVSEGVHAGIDAALALSLGPVDLAAGVRRWDSPGASGETGGHLGIGTAFGSGAYVQLIASESITDAVYGTPGGLAISAGVSMRVGHRPIGPPGPVAVGAPAANGRHVVFTLRKPDAGSVAVAGDFSGWEPRPLQRGTNGTWTLEAVLPPGVYHYAFLVDGRDWLVPSSATGIVDDGFGQKNATLIVNER